MNLIHNKIAQLIEILQHKSTSRDDLVGMELYGYYDKIPKHRILLGQVVTNNKEFHDLTLPIPQDFQAQLAFNNFRTVYIYNGLLELGGVIEGILRREVNDA